MRNIGDKLKIIRNGKVEEYEITRITIWKSGVIYEGDFGLWLFTDKDILTEARVRELQRPKVWKPKVDDKYLSMNECGEIGELTWHNNIYDKTVYSLDNCYQTKAEAEFALQKQKYLTQYKRYVEERNDKIDWKSLSQCKYYAYYDIRFGEIVFDRVLYSKHAFEVYTTSEEIILDFIRLIGEDNFKKYILEVEE